jgi:hypothetical protein
MFASIWSERMCCCGTCSSHTWERGWRGERGEERRDVLLRYLFQPHLGVTM